MGVNIVTGNIVEVNIFCKTGVQIAVNRHYYKCISHAGTGATDLEVAADFAAGLDSFYKPLLSVNATYAGAGIRRVSPGTPTVTVYDATDAGVGGVAGDMLPTQTCGIITKRTDMGGPAYRGRTYVPFPGEADSGADGLPTAGYITRLQALAAALLTDYNPGAGGNTSTLRPHFANTADWPVVFEIRSTVARAKWGTQRRRGSYGATNTAPL
jgi:hypothetical protein